MIKVAGVKYDNDAIDGGENRQDILKKMMEEGRTLITVDFVYYPKSKGGFGIKLRERQSEKIIGWLHSETAESIAREGIEYMTGFIGYHGSYHVKLDNVREPDAARYAELCEKCNKKNYLMPAYDVRVFDVPIYRDL